MCISNPFRKADKGVSSASLSIGGGSSCMEEKQDGISEEDCSRAINTKRKALFIGAHPDDIELGSAALALTLKDSGCSLRAIVLTDEKGFAEIRRHEAEAGLRSLGFDEPIVFCGFKDGDLRSGSKARERFQAVLAENASVQNPDIIVTHSSEETHSDHRSANRLVSKCLKKTTAKALFPIYGSFDAKPSECCTLFCH